MPPCPARRRRALPYSGCLRTFVPLTYRSQEIKRSRATSSDLPISCTKQKGMLHVFEFRVKDRYTENFLVLFGWIVRGVGEEKRKRIRRGRAGARFRRYRLLSDGACDLGLQPCRIERRSRPGLRGRPFFGHDRPHELRVFPVERPAQDRFTFRAELLEGAIAAGIFHH